MRKLGILTFAVSAAVLGIFLLDLHLPLGRGMGLAYLVLVLVSLRLGRVRDTWFVAVLTSVAIGSRLLVAYPEVPWSIVLIRSLLLLTICLSP